MPKKLRRPSTFSATKVVKSLARERLGTPPPSSVLPDRVSKHKQRPVKHKARLRDWMEAAAEGRNGCE